MKLFLASLASETLDLALPLLPDEPQNIKLAYIPTAADPYDLDKRSWAEDNYAKLTSIGFEISTYDLKGKNPALLRQDLSSFQVIFIEGGNVFYRPLYPRRQKDHSVVRLSSLSLPSLG